MQQGQLPSQQEETLSSHQEIRGGKNCGQDASRAISEELLPLFSSSSSLQVLQPTSCSP